MSAEKRGAARKHVRMEGLIVDTDGTVICRCLMLDISSSGAKLAMKDVSDVPDTFNLILSKKGGVRRQCEVAWRAEKTLGVRFILTPSFETEAISYMNDALARISATNKPGES
jgi:hypothetical protein